MSNPTLGWTIGGAAVGTTYAPLTVSNTQASLTSDYIPIYSQALAATVAVNISNLLGISSQVVSTNDPQTVTQKTLTNTNAYTAKDTSFTLQNASSTTKQARFLLSSITAGQTRIFTLPDYNGTIATIGGTETLTNKTLTNPTITSPALTGGSIAIDSIIGQSVSNTGTIYGLAVTTGTISGASISNATVGPNALATGSQQGTTNTNESTTSVTFTDLATVGPSVTVTIGSNGIALIAWGAETFNSNSGSFNYVTFSASGANTIVAGAVDQVFAKAAAASSEVPTYKTILLTGLNPGSTVFKLQYRVNANTGNFYNRTLTVVPL